MDPGELVSQLEDGELRLHELEVHTDAATAAAARRAFLEAQTGTELPPVDEFSFAPAETAGNIENLIGATQVPLGIAGPVTVNGGAASGPYFIPLATTEGALVASVNRGCSVIETAGGATARVSSNRMTRAPVFRVADVAEAEVFASWIRDHQDELAAAAEATTQHGDLVDATPYIVGDSVFVRFAYDTKDAMGMNMATIATEAACDVIEAETPASLIALSGNLCTDKKPAAINAITGRGRTVAADILVPRELVRERLHTTPEAIVDIVSRKIHAGSAKAVSLGHNAQAANVVAAMFLATGQDVAQVVEGANAITTAESRDGDLYMSITLASLEVGTVGGGTGLPTQTSMLDLLGVHGGGDPPGTNADALAEIIATAALGGELSLLAALASRHLSSAHEELGR